jgi:hypothetical protein
VADVAHLKTSGWNSIRLGVVWAGAQPRDEDKLDPAFVERLHAVLNLTDREGEQEEEEDAGESVRVCVGGGGLRGGWKERGRGEQEEEEEAGESVRVCVGGGGGEGGAGKIEGEMGRSTRGGGWN